MTFSWQTQNDYLRQFLSHKLGFIAALLGSYAPPWHTACRNCTHVAGERRAEFRCRDCHLHPVLCRRCIREAHYGHPLHRIQRWNGKFFERYALWQVGLRLSIMPLAGACEELRTQIATIAECEFNIDEALTTTHGPDAMDTSDDAIDELPDLVEVPNDDDPDETSER